MSDAITLGELKEMLKNISDEFNCTKIELMVFDETITDSNDIPGIKMLGSFDYILPPKTGDTSIKFYATGDVVV